MGKAIINKKFFESTRGKIALLLRAGVKTINELAERLDITDNAIRSHLQTLERDGIVKADGTVKGFRKPHSTYRLTDEARHIFPTSYDFLLNRLLDVLKEKFPSASIDMVLESVGLSIAAEQRSDTDATLDDRLKEAVHALEKLGGAAKVSRNGQLLIKSETCPFADAVSEHPEICKIAETMIANILNTEVTETCDRSGLPKCCFSIKSAE